MRTRRVLSFGNFFASAHFFLFISVLAPYLATMMPASDTGLVISLGAVITLAVFPFVPRIVGRYGPQRVALILAIIEAALLLCLALSPAFIVIVALAAFACAVSPVLAYQLDLLLEATVRSEQETGRIRTAFLTAGNIALLVSPLLIGTLLDGGDRYDRIFFVASLSLIPFIIVMLTARMPHGHIPVKRNMSEAWRRVWQDIDLRAVAVSMFILQLFYHLVPLYIPLYLHTVLGIPWGELGWVFALMLVPFVLIEYPAGVLADTKLGDRSLLIAGFAIMGLSFALIAAITAQTSILILLLILMLTRVGASLVEAMVEGHFFRRVSEEDTDTVGVFRMMRPIGALLAPLLGSLFLMISTYQELFICMGLFIAIIGTLTASAVRSFRPSRTVLHAEPEHV